jgi:hypothetical protein
MTTEYNSNSNVCVMCDIKKDNGSIKNDKFICTECIETVSPKHTPTSTPMPVMAKATTDVPRYSPNADGKCTHCKYNYGYCKDSVVVKGNWFCGKTCSRLYDVAANPLPPAYNGIFASNLCTVRPLYVNSANGNMTF